MGTQTAGFSVLILIAINLLSSNACVISRNETDPPLPAPPPIKVNGKTYIIETSFLASWYKAGQFCRLHGMNLGSINNQEENDHLVQTLTSFGLNLPFRFWTSGNDLDSNSSYAWQSTGSSFSFTSWVPTQPDHTSSGNETEHCVEIYTSNTAKGWNDCYCSSLLYFICEY